MTNDPRDAEIARLRAKVAEQSQYMLADEERRKLTGDALYAEGETHELRAQLAAAQADNVALRERLAIAVAFLEHPCLRLGNPGKHWDVIQRGKATLATPAPSAPLLDAVSGLVAAVDALLQAWDHAPPHTPIYGDGSAASDLRDALAAVRAVLSHAQDTAGISRGGGFRMTPRHTLAQALIELPDAELTP